MLWLARTCHRGTLPHTTVSRNFFYPSRLCRLCPVSILDQIQKNAIQTKNDHVRSLRVQKFWWLTLNTSWWLSALLGLNTLIYRQYLFKILVILYVKIYQMWLFYLQPQNWWTLQRYKPTIEDKMIWKPWLGCYWLENYSEIVLNSWYNTILSNKSFKVNK